MNTEFIRHLTRAIDAITDARGTTENGFVDDDLAEVDASIQRIMLTEILTTTQEPA
jgi:hypothetical protein